jgi:hypothetical protein
MTPLKMHHATMPNIQHSKVFMCLFLITPMRAVRCMLGHPQDNLQH